MAVLLTATAQDSLLHVNHKFNIELMASSGHAMPCRPEHSMVCEQHEEHTVTMVMLPNNIGGLAARKIHKGLKELAPNSSVTITRNFISTITHMHSVI